MAQCPLCNARKARRPCPALGRTICAVCCGTKRQREIACPADCGYLASSIAHPAAAVQRRQERDLRFLLPYLTELTEAQYAMLLTFQGLALRHASDSIPPLTDHDVADAANAVAATLETAGHGIIYQHHATGLPAQRLSAVFEEMVRSLSARAGAHVSSVQRDAAVALRQLARAAAEAARALDGDESPVFLKLLGRVMTAPARTSGEEPPGPSGLVITG